MNHEMTLGQLIAALEAREQAAVVNGFCNPHSYRGYYEELAFEPTANVTVSSMLRCARESVGKTFEGYKGGSYVMHEGVGVWLANYGCTGTIINDNYLAIMFKDADVNDAISAKDAEIANLQAALTEQVERRDTEIARLREALDVSALEYADAMREVNDLREHLEALVNVSEQSTIELARAALAGGEA